MSDEEMVRNLQGRGVGSNRARGHDTRMIKRIQEEVRIHRPVMPPKTGGLTKCLCIEPFSSRLTELSHKKEPYFHA